MGGGLGVLLSAGAKSSPQNVESRIEASRDKAGGRNLGWGKEGTQLQQVSEAPVIDPWGVAGCGSAQPGLPPHHSGWQERRQKVKPDAGSFDCG